MPAIRSALVVTAVWLIATGTYLVFQDDVLTRRERISLLLDLVEQEQAATLTDVEERIDTRARQMQSVLAELRINPRAAAEEATGWPFFPVLPSQSAASAFETQLYRINVGRAQIDRYRHTLIAIPVRKPLIGEIHMTSPFGKRMHPFLGHLAFHSGIDLRGDVGVAVRATATGKVTIAGRKGDYGNMVEISHGNGLATRFGHLSEISVKIGQVVRIGETIGTIGSTGRSTGPHLHYETRINGEAVDPQKFLHAGLTLADSLDVTTLPAESHEKNRRYSLSSWRISIRDNPAIVGKIFKERDAEDPYHRHLVPNPI